MSKFRSAVLAAVALTTPALVHAQIDHTRTWDVYGGFLANRTPNAGNPFYNYGWEGSLAQRSESRHWVGGMVQGSAAYTKASGVTISPTYVPAQTLYTFTAGPVFTTRVGGIAPSAHALFGVALQDTTQPAITGVQAQATYTNKHFGSTIGGGLDFPISRGHHAAIRTQADWLRVWQTTSSDSDMLKMSIGLLYSFY